MKSLLSTTLVASACVLGGAAIAQTTPGTAPGNSTNQTKSQSARTDGAPASTTNPSSPSGMGSSTTNSGAARNDPSQSTTKTDEQAARKGEPAPAGAYDKSGGRMATRQDALRGMDKDGDGSVSKSEFMTYHEAMYDRMPKDSNGNVSVAGNRRN